MMKRDIESREDLLPLLTRFYEKLLHDETIRYIFIDVAKIDLGHHLPILVNFWDMVLFHADTYRKNAIQPHIALHEKSPLTKEHFSTWLHHFSATVDEMHEGPIADQAKQKANSIAMVMQLKLAQFKK